MSKVNILAKGSHTNKKSLRSGSIFAQDDDDEKAEAPEESHQKETTCCRDTLPKVLKELTFSGIKKHFVHFWSRLPLNLWVLFVNALYVPAYRWEWKRFRSWDYNTHGKGKPGDLENKKARLGPKHQPDYLPPSERHEGCQRITFNVSGVRFQTQMRTLERFPKTLLGSEEALIRYWDANNEEFYLDRHPECFASILQYFQTGGVRLERPHDIPLHVFEDEVKFYDLGRKEVNRMLDEEGFDTQTEKTLPKNILQRKLWLLLDNQDSSKQAKLVSFISILAITVSTVILCVETLSAFEPFEGTEEFIVDKSDAIFIAETVCVTFFTLEFLVRLICSPNKTLFMKGLMNIIDFAAILPYVIQIAIAFFGGLETDAVSSQYIWIARGTKLDALFRILKIIRAFRILKFSRFSKGLRILGLTLRASLQELGLLCFFLAVGVILFSSALYFAELGDHSEYTSIPFTFYWGVSTMTTLGYGTHVPKTIIGKIIGSMCALSGVLTLSLPVPVIVANFNYFYHRETDDLRPRMAMADAYVMTCPYFPTCQEDDNEGEDGNERLLEMPGQKDLLNLSNDDMEQYFEIVDSDSTGNLHKPKNRRKKTVHILGNSSDSVKL